MLVVEASTECAPELSPPELPARSKYVAPCRCLPPRDARCRWGAGLILSTEAEGAVA